MRRVCETVLIDDLYRGSYRQKSHTGKAQKSGVFRDTTKGLRIPSVSRLSLLLYAIAITPPGIVRSLHSKQRARDQTLAVHRPDTRPLGPDGPPAARESTPLDAPSHSHNCRRCCARAGNAPISHRQARPTLGMAPAMRSRGSPLTPL